LGLLAEGSIDPKAERAVRDLLRKRGQLVRQKTANLLSIQTLLTRNTGSCTLIVRIIRRPENRVKWPHFTISVRGQHHDFRATFLQAAVG
jgi:transposase